jgi:multisubunit Na+/H+ antiporter MnhB subunit
MSSSRKYALTRLVYGFTQFVSFVTYMIMILIIVANVQFRKELRESHEALPRMNKEITLLSSIVAIGLLRQPFLLRGLLWEKLVPFFINGFLEIVCDIICLVIIFMFDGHARIVCFIHILSGGLSEFFVGNLIDNMRKTEYVVNKVNSIEE